MIDSNDEAFELLSDDESDSSFLSLVDDEPKSINIDITNGSPLNDLDFKIVHFNVNSILADGRLEELAEISAILKIDVLILTESKLCNSIPSNLLKISSFHEPLRRDRTRHGGGVLIYISESFTFKQRPELQSEMFEHISVDIYVQNLVYCVNGIYRPPNESNNDHEIFLNETEKILTKLRLTKFYKRKTTLTFSNKN